MTKQNGNRLHDQWLLEGSPAHETTLAQNFPRILAGENLSALTTQVILTVALPLQAGDVVTNLQFTSGDTGAGTPTNWWFALYTPAGALIAQTADQTSTAWAANAVKKLALSAPHRVTLENQGVYWAAIMVKATTPPTLVGRSVQHATVAGNAGSLGFKVLAQTADGSLTATAPATLGTATTVKNVPWVVAS